MSDPIEITQQATQGQQAGAIATAVGLFVMAAGAVTGLWRTIFGSKADNTAAEAQEDDALAKAADIALRSAQRADEDTKSMRIERDSCQTQLDQMHRDNKLRDEAFQVMRAELDALARENKRLRTQIEWQQRAINGLLRGSTPPTGLYTGDDVRAAMDSQQEE